MLLPQAPTYFGVGSTTPDLERVADQQTLPEVRTVFNLFRKHDETARQKRWLGYTLTFFLACHVCTILSVYMLGSGLARTYGLGQDDLEDLHLSERSQRETVTVVSAMILSFVGGLFLVSVLVQRCTEPALTPVISKLEEAKVKSVDCMREVYDPTTSLLVSRTVNSVVMWFVVAAVCVQTFLVFFTCTTSVFHHNLQSVREFVGLRRRQGSTPSWFPQIELATQDCVAFGCVLVAMIVGTVLALVIGAWFVHPDEASEVDQNRVNLAKAVAQAKQQQPLLPRNCGEEQREEREEQIKEEKRVEQVTASGKRLFLLFVVLAFCVVFVELLSGYYLWRYELTIHYFFPILCGAGSLYFGGKAWLGATRSLGSQKNDDDLVALRRTVLFQLLNAMVFFHYACNFLISFGLYVGAAEQYAVKKSQYLNDYGWGHVPVYYNALTFSITDAQNQDYGFVCLYMLMLVLHVVISGMQGFLVSSQAQMIDLCRQIQAHFAAKDEALIQDLDKAKMPGFPKQQPFQQGVAAPIVVAPAQQVWQQGHMVGGAPQGNQMLF